jgi:hypothetical protein
MRLLTVFVASILDSVSGSEYLDEWFETSGRSTTTTGAPSDDEYETEEDIPTMFPMDVAGDGYQKQRRLRSHRLIQSPKPLYTPYDFTEEQYGAMRPKLAHLARGRVLFDNTFGKILAPLLQESYDKLLVSEDGTTHRLSLGPRIAQTAHSTVFSVHGEPNLAIKYQVDCVGWGEVHPLLRDSWFLSKLEQTMLVPEVYYVSPPTPYRGFEGPKTAFTMSAADLRTCIDERKPIRFMVMQKIKFNLYHMSKGMLGADRFRMAIEFMQFAVNGLSVIHDAGVVHGDVHPGNIGWLESNRLVFFDFGLAFHLEETVGLPDRERDRLSYVHGLHSVWELEGFRPSFRDDVFKAIMVGAFLMNGDPFMEHCMSLEQNGEAMLQFKSVDFMFEVPGGGDVLQHMQLSRRRKIAIRAHLQTILDTARSVHDVNDRPDYPAIIAQLEAIAKMLP